MREIHKITPKSVAKTVKNSDPQNIFKNKRKRISNIKNYILQRGFDRCLRALTGVS